MKGPSMFSIPISLLIVAVIASNVQQSRASTAEATCLIVKNGTYIADPSSCQGWAYCVNGVPVYGKCPKGFLYDASSGSCDYADRVSCNSNVETLCTGLTNVYKADPYNCQNYCYCKDGETYTASCEDGQYYDPITISCIYSEKSTCVPNSPCILAKNGFVKDITKCDGWLRCANGQVVDSGLCPAGYYYDAYTGICDYAQNVGCSSTPGQATPGGPSLPPGVCSTAPNAKSFVADGSTCRGYFFCATDSDANPAWGQCPKNSEFSVEKQQCVDPNVALCTEDRCDGVSQSYMAVAGSNCNKYYICKNGAKTGTGECPAAYPYFNEVAQVCQVATLTYNICTGTVAN